MSPDPPATIWPAFCDALQQAGAAALAGNGGDDLGLGEGIDHLGQLLASALRWHLEGNDPDRPRFVQINDTPEIADNLFAAIRGDAVYRLCGVIDSLFDFNLSVHEGWNFRGKPRVWGDLGRSELAVGQDGRFEIILGGEQRPGNWMALPSEAAFIQIREYYYDVERHAPGVFTIERIDAVAGAAPRQTQAEAASRLADAVDWAADYIQFHKDVFERRHCIAPNTITAPARQPAGNRHIWYGFGKFELRPDEALLLEIDPAGALMWSVQWLTSPWYESAGLLDRLTGLFGSETWIGPDGIARIVIAAADPGVPNWLDTSGFDQGLFVARWIWCDDVPAPRLRRVAAGKLASCLPADYTLYSSAERALQVARRRAHFLRRRR